MAGISQQRRAIIAALEEDFTLRDLKHKFPDTTENSLRMDIQVLRDAGVVATVSSNLPSGRRGRPEAVYRVVRSGVHSGDADESAWIRRVEAGVASLRPRLGWTLDDLGVAISVAPRANSGRIRSALRLLEDRGVVVRVVETSHMPGDVTGRRGRPTIWWTCHPHEMAYQRTIIEGIRAYAHRAAIRRPD